MLTGLDDVVKGHWLLLAVGHCDATVGVVCAIFERRVTRVGTVQGNGRENLCRFGVLSL